MLALAVPQSTDANALCSLCCKCRYPGTADTPMGRYDSNPAAIKMWFAGSTAVDDEIRRMFSKDLEDARAGKLDDWKSTCVYACVCGERKSVSLTHLECSFY